nr:RnfH family protein [uncultured Pseudogulbenkiania sp.]
MTNTIEIEVTYARPECQQIITQTVAAGTTARQAVELSGIAGQFPEIDLAHLQLGVFGKAVKEDFVLRAHDRVEIYRPLIADPKEVRRRRAEAGKATKKGGGPVAE